MIAAGIGLFLLLVVAGLVFLVFRLTAPMVKGGEKFLTTLGAGSTEMAYGMASATLRSGQTKEDFARTVKAYGLDGFQSASWSTRNITNDRGHLEGTVHTKTGGSVPLTLEMIKEDGLWKVLSITGPQAGASTGPAIEKEPAAAPALPAPAGAEAGKLALASLLSFNEAIQAKSFDAFHAGISKKWQEQITPAKLLETFQPFIEAKIDLVSIKDLEPVFKSPPAVGSDGILILEGHYPTTPNKVYFRLKFVAEENAWKIVGVKVNVDE